MSGDEPYMQVRMGVVGLVALLVGCGGKTVGVPAPGSNDVAESSPTPVPAATGSSDPVPDPVAEPVTPTCDVGFARDVMPVLVEANCAQSACHGGPNPPNLPRVDPTDPKATYDGFVRFRLSDGSRYVDLADPMHSSMLCNIDSWASCGTHMPIGSELSQTETAILRSWLACGARH